MSKPSGRPSSMRVGALELIIIIAASIAAAIITKYWENRGFIPQGYTLPIYAIILLVGGYSAIRVINSAIQLIASPTLGPTRSEGIKNSFELVAGIILIISVFALFGFNLTAALISAGFLGIVLGLAAQQVLGNIFAGFSMLISKPLEIGDQVTIATSNYGLVGSTYAHESQVSGFRGVVKDVGIFFTRLLLEDGTPATFPNSVVIGALIVNHTRADGRMVKTRVDIDRRVDFNKFRDRFFALVSSVPGVVVSKSTMEVVNVGPTTYQALASVWAREVSDSVRTEALRIIMRVQDELAPS